MVADGAAHHEDVEEAADALGDDGAPKVERTQLRPERRLAFGASLSARIVVVLQGLQRLLQNLDGPRVLLAGRTVRHR